MNNTIIFFWGNAKKILTTDYFNFKGIATRKEFWYFELFKVMIGGLLSLILISTILSDKAVINEIINTNNIDISVFTWIILILIVIYGLYCVIPSFALIVRRIRDFGITNPIFIGLIVLTAMIPYVGVVIYIVIGCLPSNLLINEK